MKELAALGRVSAREKLAAKRRAKQQSRQALKQKEKATEKSVSLYLVDPCKVKKLDVRIGQLFANLVAIRDLLKMFNNCMITTV